MNLQAFLAAGPIGPSPDELRDSLAHAFNALQANDNEPASAMAREFFQGTVTDKKLQHAINELAPLQLDTRLRHTVHLTRTYAEAASCLALQNNDVLNAGAFAQFPKLRDQASGILRELARDLESCTMNAYSAGLNCVRELPDPESAKADIKSDLFAARMYLGAAQTLDDVPIALRACQNEITKQFSRTRKIDIEITEFKLVCIGASAELGKPLLDRQNAINRTYDLYKNTKNPDAPGLSQIAQAQSIHQIITQFVQAKSAPGIRL